MKKPSNLSVRKTSIYWVAFKGKEIVGLAKTPRGLAKYDHDREETFYVRDKDIDKLTRPHLYKPAIVDPYVIARRRKVPNMGKHPILVKKVSGRLEHIISVNIDSETMEMMRNVADKQDFVRKAIKFYYEEVKRRQEEKLRIYKMSKEC